MSKLCIRAFFSIPSPAAFTAFLKNILAKFYAVFIPNVYIVLKLSPRPASRELSIGCGGEDLNQILKAFEPYLEQGWEGVGHFGGERKTKDFVQIDASELEEIQKISSVVKIEYYHTHITR